MSVSVNVPEDLYRRATEMAAAENVSVDVIFASAFEDRVREFDRLQEKASRGSVLHVRQRDPVKRVRKNDAHALRLG